MLFWVSFLMFNFSYLFRVLFLVFFIISIMLIFFSSIIYLKYLVVLVYIRGVVVFILYISCMCWNLNSKFSWVFILFGLVRTYLFDYGNYVKFSDVGGYLWIFLFFRFLFNRLVTGYSLTLFKVSGSLRF